MMTGAAKNCNGFIQLMVTTCQKFLMYTICTPTYTEKLTPKNRPILKDHPPSSRIPFSRPFYELSPMAQAPDCWRQEAIGQYKELLKTS